MLTVSTINVNGLRAAAKKGYLSWLAASSADVVCLQEVRAEPDELPAEVHSPLGWHGVYAPSSLKGRAGVGIMSRVEPTSVRVGFGVSEFESSGRYVEIELPD
ncbi:MAG: exodeoxyribonuclease III, partial [Saccharothrix sp.]|nr:exodeoxyribonuclease III [Saccharothrix sp.]